MKKIFLASALALFGLVSAQQKAGFKLGAHAGLPVGDISKTHSFNVGADVAYTFEIAKNLNLGLTTGYSHYFGKSETINVLGVSQKLEVKDLGIVPAAVTAQYALGGNFFIGADLGYAFYTNKNVSDLGTFYYQPKLGFTFNGNDVYVSYKGLTQDEDTHFGGTVNLGFAHTF